MPFDLITIGFIFVQFTSQKAQIFTEWIVLFDSLWHFTNKFFLLLLFNTTLQNQFIKNYLDSIFFTFFIHSQRCVEKREKFGKGFKIFSTADWIHKIIFPLFHVHETSFKGEWRSLFYSCSLRCFFLFAAKIHNPLSSTYFIHL